MMNNIEDIEKIIGYHFNNKNLLKTALTTSSYANENNCQSYQTLEFFGDSILSFVVSDKLYNDLKIDEGKLTKMRADIVCGANCAIAVDDMGLTPYIIAGVSMEKGQGISSSVVGDIFEAVIAAIYLDGGLESAKKFICDKLNFNITDNKNYKSLLQEFVQKSGNADINYVEESRKGPAHEPIFTIGLIINGKKICSSVGGSKQVAEMQCAKIALEKLDK